MKLPLERFPIRWNHLMVKKSWYNKDESGRPDATGSKTALVLLSSMALTFGFPAMAQDANVEGRVGKLEKEMRAVQRQVFPNGAGKFVEPDIQSPAAIKTISPSSTATADLLARVDALEAQLATLTGQVEQTGNRMRGMEGRLKALETQLTVQTQPVTTPALPAASRRPSQQNPNPNLHLPRRPPNRQLPAQQRLRPSNALRPATVLRMDIITDIACGRQNFFPKRERRLRKPFPNIQSTSAAALRVTCWAEYGSMTRSQRPPSRCFTTITKQTRAANARPTACSFWARH
jgi:hypothetical protein